MISGKNGRALTKWERDGAEFEVSLGPRIRQTWSSSTCVLLALDAFRRFSWSREGGVTTENEKSTPCADVLGSVGRCENAGRVAVRLAAVLVWIARLFGPSTAAAAAGTF